MSNKKNIDLPQSTEIVIGEVRGSEVLEALNVVGVPKMSIHCNTQTFGDYNKGLCPIKLFKSV